MVYCFKGNKMKDKYNNIIKINDKLTNGEITGQIENIEGVTMLVIRDNNRKVVKTTIFRKLNLSEWELLK